VAAIPKVNITDPLARQEPFVRFRIPAALVLLGACSRGAPPAPTPTPAAPPRPAPVETRRTSAEITAAELSARLTAYAHDSMLGREAGTIGNVKATDYLAAELQRMGVEPAGENGTYFQTIPLGQRALDTTAVMSVGTQVLVLGRDYLPLPNFGDFLPFGMRGSLDGATAVYGGRLGEPAGSLTAEQRKGRLVVLLAPAGPVNAQEAIGQAARDYVGAAGVAFALLDFIPPEQQQFLREPQEGMGLELPDGPLGLLVSQRTATTLLGAAADTLAVGHVGTTVEGSFRYLAGALSYPARNVIGVVRGSDPALRNQYVAIGAHNDHVGTGEAVDHDSLWAFNRIVRPEGAESPLREATPDERRQIRALIDSLRAQRPARVDSIYNGADDDGSGTVTVLEIAEALARESNRPRRSVLFVWHTAEEKGLYGASYFTDNPTVPRDSIVAQLNMDMVGRGQIHDIEGGGSGYMQIIGSRRLSTELGDLIETVNTRGRHGFKFDYAFDADGHPQNYYCRSDHYMYARYGIPVAFFSSGSHQDYHQLTDEPQYIAYDKMARFARFILDVARTVADLDHRVVVDKPKPDPKAECRQ
jgi:hypothetical protein